jgi:hypothetical protein
MMVALPLHATMGILHEPKVEEGAQIPILYIQTKIELSCFLRFETSMQRHPNNRFGFASHFNIIADLVLNPIQSYALQYQHPPQHNRYSESVGREPRVG